MVKAHLFAKPVSKCVEALNHSINKQSITSFLFNVNASISNLATAYLKTDSPKRAIKSLKRLCSRVMRRRSKNLLKLKSSLICF